MKKSLLTLTLLGSVFATGAQAMTDAAIIQMSKSMSSVTNANTSGAGAVSAVTAAADHFAANASKGTMSLVGTGYSTVASSTTPFTSTTAAGLDKEELAIAIFGLTTDGTISTTGSTPGVAATGKNSYGGFTSDTGLHLTGVDGAIFNRGAVVVAIPPAAVADILGVAVAGASGAVTAPWTNFTAGSLTADQALRLWTYSSGGVKTRVVVIR